MDPSITVLLAEDNPDDALLMQRAFKQHGLMRPLHVVEDGAAAIAYLGGEPPFDDRALYPYPHFIMLDLKMPRLSGFEVLEWLRQRPEHQVIPTIVWSSSADLRDVKRAYCLGANGYLCKPTDFARFKVMVGHLLAFWDDCLKPSPEPAAPTCEQLQQSRPFSGAH